MAEKIIGLTVIADEEITLTTDEVIKGEKGDIYVPIYNNDKTKAELKNMRYRVIKPGCKLLTSEKALKYKEMKRIVENKNEIIQRLSTENDILKKMNIAHIRSTSKKRAASPTLYINNNIILN